MRDDSTSYLSLMDAWQDAVYFMCHSGEVQEEEETTKEVHQQEGRNDDCHAAATCTSSCTDTSPWDDAFDLLCRTMVTDEDLEEELTWNWLEAESRSALLDDDDIVYTSVQVPSR